MHDIDAFFKMHGWLKLNEQKLSLARETLEQSITACAYMRSRSAGSVHRVSMLLRFYAEEFAKEMRVK